MLIASCMILAIRTAKRPPTFDKNTADPELNQEIRYAAHLAGSVLSSLMSKRESIFPQKREPWYQPSDRTCQKQLLAKLRDLPNNYLAQMGNCRR